MKLLLILVILNGRLADHALQTGDRFPCGNTDGVGDAIADDGRPGEVGLANLNSLAAIHHTTVTWRVCDATAEKIASP